MHLIELGLLWGGDGTVVRVIAFHQCDPRLNSGSSTVLVVGSQPYLKGFSLNS